MSLSSRGRSFGISQSLACACAAKTATAFGLRRRSASAGRPVWVVGGRHGQLLDAWGMSADHPDPRCWWLRWHFLRDQSRGLSCASTGICTRHTALVQLAHCRPCVPTAAGTASASLDSRLAGRCRPTDGSEQVDDRSRSANLSTIRAGCRGTARVRAVPTALPAWLILLRGLTDACLPARASGSSCVAW